MAINPLPLPPAGLRRIAFAQASPQLVAQALMDAKQRLGRHFPTLSWATWSDTLRQLQLDLLVDGNAVTFDWQDLVRRVQALAASPEQLPLEAPLNESATAQFQGDVPQPANHLRPPLEPPFPSSGPADETVNSREQGKEKPSLTPRGPCGHEQIR
jgi:hypothetical protein